jgi:hypothetical protein
MQYLSTQVAEGKPTDKPHRWLISQIVLVLG